MQRAFVVTSSPVRGASDRCRTSRGTVGGKWNSRASRASAIDLRRRVARGRVGARPSLEDFDEDDTFGELEAYGDRDRASGRRNARESVKKRAKKALDEDDEAMRDAFLDGAEVFALTAAVGVKARAAYVEHRVAKAARASGYIEHVPPRAVTSVWGDLPLYVAVVAGTVMRRLSKAKDEASVGQLKGVPSSLKARIAVLEQATDSVMEVSRRTARDVSRLGTRVRLTRRELSPPLRKVQAETKESAQILAAVAERIELLEGELAQGQSTMSGLHTVSSKQFEVLSKAISDLKASQAELQARLAELPEPARAEYEPAELVRELQSVNLDPTNADGANKKNPALRVEADSTTKTTKTTTSEDSLD